MTAPQVARVLRAIRELEGRCLSKDSKRTTAAEIRRNGKQETKSYYHWLREQAPMTAYSYPWDFDQLMGPQGGKRR
jgi:hypothetical protein